MDWLCRTTRLPVGEPLANNNAALWHVTSNLGSNGKDPQICITIAIGV